MFYFSTSPHHKFGLFSVLRPSTILLISTKAAVIRRYLCSEDEISELCIGEEEDEEHDGEASDVLRGARKSRRELRHRFVEGNVLENLQRKSMYDISR